MKKTITLESEGSEMPLAAFLEAVPDPERATVRAPIITGTEYPVYSWEVIWEEDES